MTVAVTLSEARKNLSSLARGDQTTEIMIHGKTACYLVPKTDYQAYQTWKKTEIEKEFNAIFDEFDQLFRDLKDK